MLTANIGSTRAGKAGAPRAGFQARPGLAVTIP